MPFDGNGFRAQQLPGQAPAAPQLPAIPGGVRGMIAAWTARFRGLPVWAFAPVEPAAPANVSAAQLLRAARALIETEDRWVQGRYETVRGRRCAIGALQAAARVLRDPRAFEQAKDLLRTEAMIRGFSHVEKMNDRSTHAQVLAAFDSAIWKAESR